MFRFTCFFFYFFVFYSKENKEVKEEMYEYTDVFMYFINTSDECVNCLIEMLCENKSLLYNLIKHCKAKVHFQKALKMIFQTYFKKRVFTEDINIIDLIIEFIKISNSETDQDLTIYNEKVFNL